MDQYVPEAFDGLPVYPGMQRDKFAGQLVCILAYALKVVDDRMAKNLVGNKT